MRERITGWENVSRGDRTYHRVGEHIKGRENVSRDERAYCAWAGRTYNGWETERRGGRTYHGVEERLMGWEKVPRGGRTIMGCEYAPSRIKSWENVSGMVAW